VTLTIELLGWVLAAGGVAAAAVARRRMTSLAETVARTSHELRGPLTAVRLGLLAAFRSGQLAEPRLRAVELELARASLALEDLSAARDGRECRHGAAPVEVTELLADLVEAWGGVAAVHGAELRLLEPAGPAVVIGERLRLAQAIGNLVANAVEHGGGLVEVGCRAGAVAVSIEVVDQGPGLPAPVSELSRRRRRRAGSRRGHGLAIASAIARAHGGRLSAAPSERGARLVMELPSAGLSARIWLDQAPDRR